MALLVATLLAAPHSAGYDKVLLVVAVGLWLAHLARPWPAGAEIIALALWLCPLLGPPILSPLALLTPLLLTAFILFLLKAGVEIEMNGLPFRRRKDLGSNAIKVGLVGPT